VFSLCDGRCRPHIRGRWTDCRKRRHPRRRIHRHGIRRRCAGSARPSPSSRRQDRVMERSVAPEISDLLPGPACRPWRDPAPGTEGRAAAGNFRDRRRRSATAHKCPPIWCWYGRRRRSGHGAGESAGLGCQRHCRRRGVLPSAPDIFAAGDCTVFPSRRYGRSDPPRKRAECHRSGQDRRGQHAWRNLSPMIRFRGSGPTSTTPSCRLPACLQGYDRTELSGDYGGARFALKYFARRPARLPSIRSTIRAHT
jgi:hypothetical protein